MTTTISYYENYKEFFGFKYPRGFPDELILNEYMIKQKFIEFSMV